MSTDNPLHGVYTLLATRDLLALAQAHALARAALADAEGSTRLALQEAVTHALAGMLMDLGEHGHRSAILSRLDPASVDVQAMADECAAAWQEVKRLREDGLSSHALIAPFVGGWMDPIGSPDWMNRMRLGVPRRRDPKWAARVQRSLAGGADEDDDE